MKPYSFNNIQSSTIIFMMPNCAAALPSCAVVEEILHQKGYIMLQQNTEVILQGTYNVKFDNV